MSADFTDVVQHLNNMLLAHADEDGLTGVQRAIFLSRGGHAPGTACPSDQFEKEYEDGHEYWCESPYHECVCSLTRRKP